MDTIGKRIKYLRGIKGVTQDALADAIMENRGTLANWETDRTEPSARAIVAIANYFHISTDFILGRNADTVKESALFFGLDEKEKKLLEEQADFYRYRKTLPGDDGNGSSGLTNSSKNGGKINLKREKGRRKAN